MKKTKFFLAGVSMMIMLGGCDNFSTPITKEEPTDRQAIPLREQVSVESLDSSLAKAVWHQVNATEMIVEAIENYTDIPELEAARYARNNSYDLWAFVESLPSDLASRERLRRTSAFQGRSINDNDTTLTITLEEELNEIAASFSTSMKEIIPVLNVASISDDIIVDGDFIYMPDGEKIHMYSLDGIATIEVLNAIANGEDAESAAQRISSEIESFMAEDASSARGLFINPILKWPGGIVRYTFQSNFRPDYRTATRNAMNAWETGSNNKVKFTQIDLNAITSVLSLIGALPILQISEKNLNGASGQATPGSPLTGIPFIGLVYSYLYLAPNNLPATPGTVEEVGKQNAYSVALHELGHVLGLQHEHQRADRDKYVKVTDSTQFKIPEITLTVVNSIRIEMRSKKIAFIKIWYPVIVISTSSHPQFKKTAFDPLSIMIYSGLEIVDPKFKNDVYATKPPGTTTWRTKYTTRLSDHDKAFIRTLY